MFPVGQHCVVKDIIRLFEPGRVTIRGESWKAELYEFNCPTPLKQGQPALAIGRKANRLLVIPLHCLLWDFYLEKYSLHLRSEDIRMLDYYERNWRL